MYDRHFTRRWLGRSLGARFYSRFSKTLHTTPLPHVSLGITSVFDPSAPVTLLVGERLDDGMTGATTPNIGTHTVPHLVSFIYLVLLNRVNQAKARQRQGSHAKNQCHALHGA